MTSYKNQVTLLDLLSQYPIVRALAEALPFGGLLSLARLNSHYRNILHGFSPDAMKLDHCKDRNYARLGLWLGEHETSHWRNLKSLCQMICSEPKHTKGSNPRGCRMCSMPVCEGCIVKASFGKQEKTFQNRRRRLCPECWVSSNPLREHPIEPLHIGKPVSYTPHHQDALVFQGYCACTARDGWLCLRCKTAQKVEPQIPAKVCAGQSCSNPLDKHSDELRACLWCHLPLSGRPSREESRRDYDSRHLYARSHSNTWAADEEYYTSANYQPHSELWKTSSDAGRAQRHLIPYSEQRYFPPDKKIPVEEFYQPSLGPPPTLKVRGPRPLQNFALVDYSSLGVTSPSAQRLVDSIWGELRYDIDFLLAFRPVCLKEPTADWESRVVNTILQPDDSEPDIRGESVETMLGSDDGGESDEATLGVGDGDESDEATLGPADGEGSDEATLGPEDGEESDEMTLATPRISSDGSFTLQRSWIWSR